MNGRIREHVAGVMDIPTPVDPDTLKVRELQNLVGAINNLEFPDSSPTDLSPLLQKIDTMNGLVRQLVDILKQEKPVDERRWEFTVHRYDSNRIKSVTAVRK